MYGMALQGGLGYVCTQLRYKTGHCNVALAWRLGNGGGILAVGLGACE
jgi:hypothetical protein